MLSPFLCLILINDLPASQTVYHAPPGYFLLLKEDDGDRVRLVSHFDCVYETQVQPLCMSNGFRLYDAGGGGLVSKSCFGECGYIISSSDGRTYNTRINDLKTNGDTFLGRVILFKPNAKAVLNANHDFSLATLNRDGEIGYPKDRGWPSLQSVRFAFSFDGTGNAIVIRPIGWLEWLLQDISQ